MNNTDKSNLNIGKTKAKFNLKIIIFILLVSFLTFTVGLQVVLFSVFSKNNYIDSRSEVLEEAFNVITENYNGTHFSVRSAVSELQEEYGIDIIVRTDNKIIYINQPHKIKSDGFGNNFFYLYGDYSESYSKKPEAVLKENEQGKEQLALFGQFESFGETIYVDIVIHMDAINSSLAAFFETTIINSIVVLLISLIVAAILSRFVAKPISEMEATIAALSKLEFKTKLSENWRVKEISNVSASINTMSSKLEESISELSEANIQLKKDVDAQKKLVKMRKEFVANVSHEMKTPLALLQIYAENLNSNIENIDKDFYLNTILEETNNLNELVASMLDISALENDYNQMHLEELNLTDLASHLTESMKPLLNDFDLEIFLEDNIIIMGAEGYLKQAMSNYITNAISHTKAGEKIQIILTKENEKIVFKVYNKGNQINPEEFDYIWDSFYRVDKARNRDAKNIGMGLYIVKTIIDKHNGYCDVKNIDEGVEFKFALDSIENHK